METKTCPHCRSGIQHDVQSPEESKAPVAPVDIQIKSFLDPREGPDAVRERIDQHFKDLGISARATIMESHLLPHEGGKLSREGQELEHLLALDEERKAKEALEAPELAADKSCLYCIDGTDWRSGEPQICKVCQDVDLSQPIPEDLESQDSQSGTAPLAPPGVLARHLLPHEGGKRSKEGQELERQIQLFEERKAKYGKDYWYYAKVNGW